MRVHVVQRQKVTVRQSSSGLCHLEINELPVRVPLIAISCQLNGTGLLVNGS